jgi:hypothetical protein
MSRAVCPKCGCTDVSWIRDDADCAQYICLECKQAFCYPPKTVFDTITASHEVLAEEFVEPYTRWGEDRHLETLWRSNFRELSGMLFDTREKAIAATIEKLKEVEKCESI